MSKVQYCAFPMMSLGGVLMHSSKDPKSEKVPSSTPDMGNFPQESINFMAHSSRFLTAFNVISNEDWHSFDIFVLLFPPSASFCRIFLKLFSIEEAQSPAQEGALLMNCCHDLRTRSGDVLPKWAESRASSMSFGSFDVA